MSVDTPAVVIITIISADDDAAAGEIIQLRGQGELPSLPWKALHAFGFPIVEIDPVISRGEETLLVHQFREEGELQPFVDDLVPGQIEVVGIAAIDVEPC